MVNSKTLVFYVGSAIAQVVTLATTLYIINHFTPSAFGSFSYFVSIGSILGSFATLKYELSITISKNTTEANSKVNLTFVLSFLINFILLIAYSVFFLNSSLYELSLILLLANSVSFNASLQQLLLFNEKHIYSGLFPVIIAVSNFLLLIFIFNDDSGLFISYVISSFLTVIIFLILLAKAGLPLKLYSFSFYKNIFKTNISFPKYILPGSVSVILLTYFHPILVGLIYSKYEIGLFSFALRILLLPTIIIGSVLSGLLRAKLSKLYYDNNLVAIQDEVRTVLKWLFVTCLFLFPFILICIFNLKYFIDMDKWQGVERVALLLLLYSISQFFYQPLSNIALVFDKKKILLKLNIIQLVLTIIIYLVAFILNLSFFNFLNILSITFLFFTLYAGIVFLQIVKKQRGI